MRVRELRGARRLLAPMEKTPSTKSSAKLASAAGRSVWAAEVGVPSVSVCVALALVCLAALSLG